MLTSIARTLCTQAHLQTAQEDDEMNGLRLATYKIDLFFCGTIY